MSLSKGEEGRLARIGVRDSKLLTRKKREFLFNEIYDVADEVKFYKIEVNEINAAMKSGMSLNELEALKFAKLVDELETQPSKVIFDSPDVIPERFGLRVSLFSSRNFRINGIKSSKINRNVSKEEKAIRLVAEHKADSRYPVVSSASIIAKVVRDREIQKIYERLGVDIGSGYPSDKLTLEAIKEHLGTAILDPFMRLQWSTIKNIRQLRIEDFVK